MDCYTPKKITFGYDNFDMGFNDKILISRPTLFILYLKIELTYALNTLNLSRIYFGEAQ